MKKCKTLEYYIDKYGNIKGCERFKNIQKKKATTLEAMINKYGKKMAQKNIALGK